MKLLSGLRGSLFLNTLRNFRFAWIGGRYGGFKTALSVRCGIEFVERGWSKHIITNFPCVVATDLHKLDDLRNCYIVLDEAGSWMEEDDLRSTIAFLRKRNLTVVFPSVIPPPIKARMLNIQMTWDLHSIGLDCVVYSALLDYMRVKDKYNLWWWRPSETFGLWDTSYVINDDAGIITFIRGCFAADQVGRQNEIEFPAWFKAESAKSDRAAARHVSKGDGVSEVEKLRWVAEDVHEAASRITEAVSVSKRGRSRRKRG